MALALGRLRREDWKLEVGLLYIEKRKQREKEGGEKKEEERKRKQKRRSCF